MRKYEFTGETKTSYGLTLKRIRRLSDGVLGGWIEKESNLSQCGSCWVSRSAVVCGEARVFGEARVCGDAVVCGSAEVSTRVFNLNYYQYNITMTDYLVKIGCKKMLAYEWLHVGIEDAVKMGLHREEYPRLKDLLNVIIPHHFEKELK